MHILTGSHSKCEKCCPKIANHYKIKDIALYENCGFSKKNFDHSLKIEFDKDKVNQKINNELSKKPKSNIHKNHQKSPIDRAKSTSQQTTNKNKAISKDER